MIQMILKGAEKCLLETRIAVQRFNTRHYGVDIVETSPDGNCAIYAIQDQLQYIHHAAEFESHQQIRARINTNIRGILKSLTEQQLKDIFLEARVYTINQYIARMGEDRFWLDHVAIFALAIDLNVQIEVYLPRSLRGSPPYAVYTSNAGKVGLFFVFFTTVVIITILFEEYLVECQITLSVLFDFDICSAVVCVKLRWQYLFPFILDIFLPFAFAILNVLSLSKIS